MNGHPVNVIVPTLRKYHAFTLLESLHYIPFPIHLILESEGSNWAQAINNGLKKINSQGDVLLIDDDVELFEHTFFFLKNAYDKADIFGFKLLFPNGKVQHGGGVAFHVEQSPDDQVSFTHIGFHESNSFNPDVIFNKKMYVCHVTASLMYIKRPVINSLKGMHEFDGQQFEDVDFSMRALKNGYKIMYLPGEAVHSESATKSQESDFMDRLGLSLRQLIDKHELFYGKNEFATSLVKDYPIEI